LVGSSYDNALAETTKRLYKTELIEPAKARRPSTTLNWQPRTGGSVVQPLPLYEYSGDMPPVELEAGYYAQHRRPAAGRAFTSEGLRTHRGFTTPNGSGAGGAVSSRFRLS
jgi:hypothetical protein